MDAYYDVLNIKRGATDAEIKKAYRKECLKHHPDKGGDKNYFTKLTRAHDVLSDKEKRAQYDVIGLDIEENEAEDQMFANESKEIMQILGSFGIKTLLGFLFMFFIYYTFVVVLATGGMMFLVYYAQTQGKDVPDINTALARLATYVVLSWLSLWSDWFRWILQTAILLEIIGLVPSSDSPVNVSAIATSICAFLSWWFGKSWSYYVYILILEALLALVVFLFFEFARVVIKTALETKLKKYGEKVREVVDPIKAENAKLKQQLEKLKARANK